jgi:hypothetical protein
MLALIALITHSVARGFLEDAMHREGARIHQIFMQHITQPPDSQELQSSRMYNVLTIVGVVLTVLSVVCAVTASVRREQGWYLILMLVWLGDIVAPMLL